MLLRSEKVVIVTLLLAAASALLDGYSSLWMFSVVVGEIAIMQVVGGMLTYRILCWSGVDFCAALCMHWVITPLCGGLDTFEWNVMELFLRWVHLGCWIRLLDWGLHQQLEGGDFAVGEQVEIMKTASSRFVLHTYYPVELQRVKSEAYRWLEPHQTLSDAMIRGFSRFVGHHSWLHRHLRGRSWGIWRDAPIARPQSSRHSPFIVFSPGLGTVRHLYLGLARSWASRGIVVCVVEHGDGSLGAVEYHLDDVLYHNKLPRPFPVGAEWMSLETEHLPYWQDVNQRLRIRVGEFAAVVEHVGGGNHFAGQPEHLLLAGHSYGGGTVASFIMSAKQQQLDAACGALFLDMWTYPMSPAEKIALTQRSFPLPAALHVNSQQWVHSRSVASCAATPSSASSTALPAVLVAEKFDHTEFSDAPFLYWPLAQVTGLGNKLQHVRHIMNDIASLAANWAVTGSMQTNLNYLHGLVQHSDFVAQREKHGPRGEERG
jgi:dienelactone hydrolase